MSSSQSLTLDETNAIRDRIGLDRLTDTDDIDERAAVNAARQVEEQRQQQADRDAVAANITARREARLYQQSISGQGIAEQCHVNETASQWIQQLKQKTADGCLHPPPAPIASTRHISPVNGPDLQIRHDNEEFTHGETVTLTLKDRRIGEGSDSEHDELENIQLVEEKRLQRNADRKAKRHRPSDDNDTELPTRTVLHKYDDVKDELDAKRGGLTLRGDGGIIDRSISIRDKLQNTFNKTQYDLGSNGNMGIGSDFYTEQEMSQFKKPSAVKKMRKKIKKTPRSTKLILDDVAVDSSAVSGDHGSRQSSALSVQARMAQHHKEMEAKRLRFQAAQRQSDSLSHVLLDNISDDDDMNLDLSSVRSRRQEIKQQVIEATRSKQPTAKISALSKEYKERDQGTEGIQFSTASEFMTNLRVNVEESKELRAQAVQQSSILASTHEHESVHINEIGVIVKEEEEEEDMEIDDGPNMISTPSTVKEEVVDESDDDVDEGEFMADVSSLHTGVGGALRLIRHRGVANRPIQPMMAGRSRDGHDEYKDPAPQLRLDRVDEFGRKMTQKEAFRELSYVFHGHRPGAKKREKLLKEKDQQLKQQQLISGQTLTSTDRLRDAQVRTQRHYVVMDSRSGALGSIATQKLAIDVTDDNGVQQDRQSGSGSGAISPARHYPQGSKKVEFALNKTDQS